MQHQLWLKTNIQPLIWKEYSLLHFLLQLSRTIVYDNALDISDHGSDCRVDGTFTVEFDIVGPQQFENGTGTFELTRVSGTCDWGTGSCTSIYNAFIDE